MNTNNPDWATTIAIAMSASLIVTVLYLVAQLAA